MEAPLCKICRSRHYGPCIITPAPTPSGTAPYPRHKEKTEFDRNTYQKEYMRNYMREYMREYRKAQERVHAIYAIVQTNEPEIVKIGQTKHWDGRKTAFKKAKRFCVYFIDEPVDLLMIENACIRSIGTPPCHGREWFRTSIDHACSCIENILNTLKLPYKIEKGEDEVSETGNEAFDRNVYQKQYMRKYMKEYMRKRRSTAKVLGS